MCSYNIQAQSAGVQITAYNTDRILSEKTDDQSDRLIFYGEPTPETVGPLLEYTKDKPVQKMLVMADKPVTDKLRPHLLEALGGDAEITVAIPGMLEVGSSLLKFMRCGEGLGWPWRNNQLLAARKAINACCKAQRAHGMP